MRNNSLLVAILLFWPLIEASQGGWSEPTFVDTLLYSQPPWNAIEARNDSIYVIYDFFNFIRSTDGGQTWQDQFVNSDGGGFFDVGFKLTGDTLVAFFKSSGIMNFYFSTDAGESWQGPRFPDRDPGYEVSANYNHSHIAVCKMTYDEPFATHIFLKNSTDFGTTWAEAESIWTYPGPVFDHFLYYFYDRAYVLSSGYDGGLGLSTIKLLFSADNGESWIAHDSLSEVGAVWEQRMDASDGGHMAFVYHRYNSWIGSISEVFVALSADSGLTWATPVDVSLYDINYFPCIAVSGDTVIASWHGRADTSDTYGAVLVRRTFNFGESWEDVEIVTDRGENGRFPEIAIDGEIVHLIYKTYDGLYYRRWEPETGVEKEIRQPSQFSLSQNHPNPFNAATTISYALPEPGEVVISIFNLLGQRVATIYEGSREAGEHKVVWDAAAFPSGIYFARLAVQPVWEAGERTENIKMVLLK